jgi:transcriptional regulator NrdR family protein
MNYLAILDLVIGLIFIYFLMGLFCSTFQELMANAFNLRARNLNHWIKDTFHKNDFGKQLLNHTLIDGLTAKGRKASYIPPDVFSHALLDLVHRTDTRPYSASSLREAIQQTPHLSDDLKQKLLQSLEESNGQVAAVRQSIESWFNQAMERISGTYKKRSQRIILLAAMVIVSLLNVDTIAIIRYLYDHPTQASALADHVSTIIQQGDVTASDSTAASSDIQQSLAELKTIRQQLEKTQLPLGWEQQGPLSFLGIATKIIGLLLTAFAALVGAPFWFEMLNKLVNLRSAGNKPPTESKDEKK